MKKVVFSTCFYAIKRNSITYIELLRAVQKYNNG